MSRPSDDALTGMLEGPLTREPAEGIPPVPEPEPPPEAVLFQMCMEYLTSALFLHVGILGIPDLLTEGPRSIDELARASKVDPESLYRVLRMLAARGVFSEVPARTFRQTPASDALRIFRVSRMFQELPRVLETGHTGVQLAFGVSDWEYFDRHPEESALFDRLQALLAVSHGDAIVAANDWSSVSRVLDIGGGTGTLISAILTANPRLTGVLFERRAVVADARAALAQRGLAERCAVVEGDFMQAVAPVEADVLILSHIVHDWDDVRALTILRNARAAMRPGDRLLVLESVLPPGDRPHPSKPLDVMMLAFTGGRERSAEEYRDLLARAELRLSRIVGLSTNESLIEAVIGTCDARRI